MSSHSINPVNNNQRVSGSPGVDTDNQSALEQLKANQSQYADLVSRLEQTRGSDSSGSGSINNGLLDLANQMLTENDRAIQRMNGSADIVEHDFHIGEEGEQEGSGQDENGHNQHATSPLITAAKALLRQVLGFIKIGGSDVNPNVMIANYSQGSKIAELAKTLAEAGMTEEVVEGNSQLRHEALEVDTRAAGVKGEFDTQIQYWKDVLQGNKQAEKDTHDQARRG